MKIRKREKMPPIYLAPGDTIELSYKESAIYPDGEVEVEEKKVLESAIGRELTLNEAVIFDVEEGDFEGAEDGIGGAFLSSKQ